VLVTNSSAEFETYKKVEKEYIELDRNQVLRTRNIKMIPAARYRFGGKISYAEWAHQIGIFQTLIYLHCQSKSGNVILDAGCGAGLVGIAADPFVSNGGKYLGLDVKKDVLEFCRSHYPCPPFQFIHLDSKNAEYANSQEGRCPWPLEDKSIDLITALSLWSHLNEDDALFYLKEASRVLRPHARAIITGFLLDEYYYDSLDDRTDKPGQFDATFKSLRKFEVPVYGSDAWYHPKWVAVPEKAIGFTKAGLERMLAASGLKLIEYHPGTWKEVPGMLFQDILIFER